ncbi:MAG TPA: rod shape-determining protein MreC [Planctomycetes bacterium]|nr:rod shape-determining protein MreC [Planctomycetota bacterium]
MARKLIRVSRRMLFTWLMLAGLILLFAPQNLTNNFQFAFARLFRLPLAVGRNISLFTRSWQSRPGITNRRESEYENYIANLTEQLHSERQLVEKLTTLRNKFGLQGADLIPADVVTASIGGAHCELIIYCRREHGLAKGQFVLGDNSIIGTISDVSAPNAKVRLFTDPASKIPVRIGKLNIDRVMQGSGNNSAKVSLLSTKHNIKVGDHVLTCKKPGFLDTSLIIGTVARCKPDEQNPSLWDITVKPVCDIERLNSVTVIIMNPQE